MGKSDEQLMRDFKDGDPSCFDILMERYHRPVYAIILSMGRDRVFADDVFQEVFLKVIRMAETFDSDRRFSSWLFKIADNACIDALRKMESLKKRSIGDESFLNLAAAPISENPELRLIADERRKSLWEAMARLPETQRQVIVLREFAGYSYEEISEMTQRPLNTALSDMRRGLKRLREIWPEGKIHAESD